MLFHGNNGYTNAPEYYVIRSFACIVLVVDLQIRDTTQYRHTKRPMLCIVRMTLQVQKAVSVVSDSIASCS